MLRLFKLILLLEFVDLLLSQQMQLLVLDVLVLAEQLHDFVLLIYTDEIFSVNKEIV